MSRTCKVCHKSLPESAYSSNGKGRYKSRCRVCRNADERARMEAVNNRKPVSFIGWPVPQ